MSSCERVNGSAVRLESVCTCSVQREETDVKNDLQRLQKFIHENDELLSRYDAT